jgi:ATP/maltotriose-dependent transcriptional regulator MalT
VCRTPPPARILVEASETGKESELIELVGRTGAKLRARLDPGATGAGAAASLPADPEAARLYSEGLATLRALDPTGAVPLLERAAGLTPDFAPVHAALAAAYGDLGRERDTESAARRAFERSAGLPREERLVIEGRFREASRDWPRAIAVYRSLRELYPDDLEHGLLLARAQIKQGQLADAAATVTALRALRGAADDPRLDLIAPERNYRVSLELALSAARKAKARGARFVEAEALANAAWSSLYLGDLPRARAMLDEARAIQRALGSRLGEFYVLNALAPVQSLAGDGRAAAATFAEAVAMATSIGSRSLNVIALGNLVFIHLDNGDLALARAALAELQPLAHEADEIARVVYALRLESWLRRDEGDLPAARARLEEAERLARTRGVEDDDQPWSQILRTEIDLRAGDAELALAGLRRVEKELVERDDILSLTETRALMVEALLQLGRTDEALREAQAVAAAGERFAAFAPLSAALLAQARLAAGQRSEAAAALDAARPHARVGTLAKQAAYALAELAVRTGSAEARARVEAIRADAERRGLPYLALEARLALAEDARAAGKRAPDLAAIERDARRRGFLALAARAASR